MDEKFAEKRIETMVKKWGKRGKKFRPKKWIK